MMGAPFEHEAAPDRQRSGRPLREAPCPSRRPGGSFLRLPPEQGEQLADQRGHHQSGDQNQGLAVREFPSSTRRPIMTKKSGTKNMPSGCIRSESVASSSGVLNPLTVGVEHDADGERPDDVCQADQLGGVGQGEAERQADDEQETTLPVHAARRMSGADKYRPNPIVPPRKSTARNRIRSTVPRTRPAPAAAAVAAPRRSPGRSGPGCRRSRRAPERSAPPALGLPKVLQDAAVIPTLVAESVAPMKT